MVVLPDLLEVIWLFDRFLKKDFEKPDVGQVADFGVPAAINLAKILARIVLLGPCVFVASVGKLLSAPIRSELELPRKVPPPTKRAMMVMRAAKPFFLPLPLTLVLVGVRSRPEPV